MEFGVKNVAGDGKKKARNFRPPPFERDRLRPISTSASFFFRLRPISTSANFDFGQFLDVEFWDHKGGGPNLEKVGVEAWGPEAWGPEGWGGRRVGAPKGGGPNLEEGWGPEGWGSKISRFFFPSPATIFTLLSLSWGSFRGILVVFEALGS